MFSSSRVARLGRKAGGIGVGVDGSALCPGSHRPGLAGAGTTRRRWESSRADISSHLFQRLSPWSTRRSTIGKCCTVNIMVFKFSSRTYMSLSFQTRSDDDLCVFLPEASLRRLPTTTSRPYVIHVFTLLDHYYGISSVLLDQNSFSYHVCRLSQVQ